MSRTPIEAVKFPAQGQANSLSQNHWRTAARRRPAVLDRSRREIVDEVGSQMGNPVRRRHRFRGFPDVRALRSRLAPSPCYDRPRYVHGLGAGGEGRASPRR